MLRLLLWTALLGVGGVAYGLVVVDDVVKRSGGDMPSVTRLMRPSTILNLINPPPDIRAQKDDLDAEPAVADEAAKGFQKGDCLDARASRYTHPKLAALVFEECRRLGIDVLGN